MPFSTTKSDINAALLNLEAEELILSEKRQALDLVNRQLKADAQAGLSENPSLANDKAAIETAITTAKGNIAGHQSTLQGHYNTYNSNYTMQSAVTDLNDDFPILLFPVRLETRFHETSGGLKQLWVRVFPDQIAIESHENTVTATELSAAKEFWQNLWEQPDRTKRLNEWNALALRFGRYRAAYLIDALRPMNYATDFNDGDDQDPNKAPIVFPADPDLKYDAWTEAAFVRTLPDHFQFRAYTSYPATYKEENGKVIPDKLTASVAPYMEGATLDANEELKWMYDFVEAIDKGMGVKIDLTGSFANAYTNGFERVTAVGVKALSSTTRSSEILEELFANHHFTQGLNILKNGTDTKNTEFRSSGWSKYEFTNSTSFGVECESPLFGTGATTLVNTPNGKLLSEAFGADYSIFQHIYNADGQDISNAIHMNNALFQATAGYSMRELFTPWFNADDVAKTRSFFTDYVRGRGALPSIGVGSTPYGILPTSVLSRMTFDPADPEKPYKDNRNQVLGTMKNKWTEIADSKPVPGTSAPNQVFKDIVGHNSHSTKYYERNGIGPEYTWNSLNFNDRQTDAQNWEAGTDTFFNNWKTETGFVSLVEKPKILQYGFQPQHKRTDSDIVDPYNPSQKRELPLVGTSQINFINWLRTSSIVTIMDEDFIAQGGGAAPDSLLYIWLRQALLLEYYHTAADLLGRSEEDRKEGELLNFTAQTGQGEGSDLTTQRTGRWEIFNEEYPVGSGQSMGVFLDGGAAVGLPESANLYAMKEDLEKLESLSTEELYLLTNEHADLCSHRLDAWVLGVFDERLKELRAENPNGIYLGAYGWVENLKPKALTTYTGAALPENFTGDYYQVDDNQGYILAPSLQHGKAAALLRSGYEKNADDSSAEKEKAYEINLSSQRVQQALKVFEALTAGQSLGQILGYLFEREMKENNLQKFVYDMRVKFPLDDVAGVDSDYGNGKTAYTRVCDGKKIIDSYTTWDENGSEWYDDELDMTVPSTAERATIKGIIQYLEGILDALADLSTAEAVFQMVNGNNEAANAIMEGMADDPRPLDPEITKLRRTGIDVSNRMVLPLTTDTDLDSEWAHTTGDIWEAVEPTVNYWARQAIGNPENMYGAANIWHDSMLGTERLSCFHFNGDSYLRIGESTNMPANGFILKFKARLPYGEADNTNRMLFSIGSVFRVIIGGLSFGGSDPDHMLLRYDDGNVPAHALGVGLSKEWREYEFRIGTSLEIYVDGEQVSLPSPVTIDLSQVSPFAIDFGAFMFEDTQQVSNYGHFFLSDLRMYEVDNSVTPLGVGPLTARFLLDETSGAVCKDDSILQNHGTIVTSNPDTFFSKSEKVYFNLKDLGVSALHYLYMTPDDIQEEESELANRAVLHLGKQHGLATGNFFRYRSPIVAEYDFSAGLNDWANNGAATLTQDTSRLKVNSTEKWAAAQCYFDTIPGKEYQVDLGIDYGQCTRLALEIFAHDPGSTILQIIDVTDQKARYLFTATTGRTRIKISRLDETSAGSLDFYLDSLKLVTKEMGSVGYTFDFSDAPANLANAISFASRHRLIAELRRVLFNSKPMKTTDFIQPGTIGNEHHEDYDFDEYRNRVKVLQSSLAAFWNPDAANLGSINAAFKDYNENLDNSVITYTHSVSDLKQLLADASVFGIPEALPTNLEDAEAEREVVMQKLGEVGKVVESKHQQLSAILDNVKFDNENPSDAEKDAYVEILQECVVKVLGKNFKLLPKFSLPSAEGGSIELQASAAGNDLFKDANGNAADALDVALKLEDWKQGLAKVRKNVYHLEMYTSVNETFNGLQKADSMDVTPFQLPYDQDGNDRWMAMEVPGQEYVKPNRLCIAVLGEVPLETDPDTPHANVGLIIDDWTEVIPAKEETGAAVFHFEQPRNQAPQCLLMAVTPNRTGSWDWADVFDTVNETLDLAKERAVEYEDLAATGYGQVLPAINIPKTKSGQTIGISQS